MLIDCWISSFFLDDSETYHKSIIYLLFLNIYYKVKPNMEQLILEYLHHYIYIIPRKFWNLSLKIHFRAQIMSLEPMWYYERDGSDKMCRWTWNL